MLSSLDDQKTLSRSIEQMRALWGVLVTSSKDTELLSRMGFAWQDTESLPYLVRSGDMGLMFRVALIRAVIGQERLRGDRFYENINEELIGSGLANLCLKPATVKRNFNWHEPRKSRPDHHFSFDVLRVLTRLVNRRLSDDASLTLPNLFSRPVRSLDDFDNYVDSMSPQRELTTSERHFKLTPARKDAVEELIKKISVDPPESEPQRIIALAHQREMWGGLSAFCGHLANKLDDEQICYVPLHAADSERPCSDAFSIADCIFRQLFRSRPADERTPQTTAQLLRRIRARMLESPVTVIFDGYAQHRNPLKTLRRVIRDDDSVRVVASLVEPLIEGSTQVANFQKNRIIITTNENIPKEDSSHRLADYIRFAIEVPRIDRYTPKVVRNILKGKTINFRKLEGWSGERVSETSLKIIASTYRTLQLETLQPDAQHPDDQPAIEGATTRPAGDTESKAASKPAESYLKWCEERLENARVGADELNKELTENLLEATAKRRPEWVLLLELIAASPSGLKRMSVWSLLQHIGTNSYLSKSKPRPFTPSSLAESIDGFIECFAQLVREVFSDALDEEPGAELEARLSRDDQAVLSKFSRQAIDFSTPEFRTLVLSWRNSPKRFAYFSDWAEDNAARAHRKVLHRMLADEALRRHALVVRSPNTPMTSEIRPFRRLIQGIYHGYLSLPSEEPEGSQINTQTKALIDNCDTGPIPGDANSAVRWLSWFATRQLLDHFPYGTLPNEFGTNELRIELALLSLNPEKFFDNDLLGGGSESTTLLQSRLLGQATMNTNREDREALLRQSMRICDSAIRVGDQHLLRNVVSASRALVRGESDPTASDDATAPTPTKVEVDPLIAIELDIRDAELDLLKGEFATALSKSEDTISALEDKADPEHQPSFERLSALLDTGSEHWFRLLEINYDGVELGYELEQRYPTLGRSDSQSVAEIIVAAELTDMMRSRPSSRIRELAVEALFQRADMQAIAAESLLAQRLIDNPRSDLTSVWRSFADSFSTYHTADALRRKNFHDAPGETTFHRNLNSLRIFTRVALKLEHQARRLYIKKVGSSPKKQGFFELYARRTSAMLAMHSSLSIARCNSLILDATFLRLLADPDDSPKQQRDLEHALSILTRAEPMADRFDPSSRIWLTFLLERTKVHRRLADMSSGEQRKRYHELAQADVSRLERVANAHRSGLWQEYARNQKTRLGQIQVESH